MKTFLLALRSHVDAYVDRFPDAAKTEEQRGRGYAA